MHKEEEGCFMKGRKLGSTEITLADIKEIIKQTNEGYSRPEIAKKLNRSKDTIYRYQKKYL